MIDDPDRSPWDELHALDQRFVVRTNTRSACPVCFFAPTRVTLWDAVAWGSCDPCGTAWPIGRGVLDVDHATLAAELAELGLEGADRAALEEAIRVRTIETLTTYEILSSIHTKEPQTMAVKPNSSTAPETFGVNPRLLQGPKERRILPDATIDEVVAVTDAVLHFLRTHEPPRTHPMTGEAIWVGCNLWEFSRGITIDARGTTIETVVCRPDNRGGEGLYQILEVLLAAESRRVELRRQLDHLDRVGRALDGAAASVA